MIRQQTSVHASEEAGDERLRPLGSRPVALRVMVFQHRHGFRLRNEKIALPLQNDRFCSARAPPLPIRHRLLPYFGERPWESIDSHRAAIRLSFSRLAFVVMHISAHVRQTPSVVMTPGNVHRCTPAPRSPHVIAIRKMRTSPRGQDSALVDGSTSATPALIRPTRALGDVRVCLGRPISMANRMR
jgi:hypothetical protein